MSTIQELISEYARTNSDSDYREIVRAVRESNKLWAAYSPVTKNSYMEYFNGKPTAFLFSEKGFCETFREHLAPHNVKIETELCKPETRIQLFGDFYRSGIEHIIIDNGQQFVCIGLFDVIEKPDFSSLSPQYRPVVNPSLLVNANLFFQTFDAGTATKNTRKKMLRSLYQGKYLMPVIVEHDTPLDGLEKSTLKAIATVSGTAVTVPALELDDGQTLIPFFTDWTEFSRFDKDKQCAGNIVTFREMEYFCEQGEKIAVNPFGFNMVVDSNALALIKKLSSDIELEEEVFETEPMPEEKEVFETEPMPEEEPITLFELRSVPHEMIQILQSAMEQTDGVQAAYLKGMTQGEQNSYLVIVDFSGDRNLLNNMAWEVMQQMQEIPIEFILADSELGSQAVQSTYPFYQRN